MRTVTGMRWSPPSGDFSLNTHHPAEVNAPCGPSVRDTLADHRPWQVARASRPAPSSCSPLSLCPLRDDAGPVSAARLRRSPRASFYGSGTRHARPGAVAWNEGWWTGYPGAAVTRPLGRTPAPAARRRSRVVDDAGAYHALLWVASPGARRDGLIALAPRLASGWLRCRAAFRRPDAVVWRPALASGVEGGVRVGMLPAAPGACRRWSRQRFGPEQPALAPSPPVRSCPDRGHRVSPPRPTCACGGHARRAGAR